MKTVVIDFHDFNDSKSVHEFLAERLDFPDYYGKNLDALYDVLTTDIRDVNILVLPTGRDWEQRMIKVFTDSAAENPYFSVGVKG